MHLYTVQYIRCRVHGNTSGQAVWVEVSAHAYKVLHRHYKCATFFKNLTVMLKKTGCTVVVFIKQVCSSARGELMYQW